MSIRGMLDKYFIKKPTVREAVTKIFYGSNDADIELMGLMFRINALSENGYLRASRAARMKSVLEDEVATLISIASALREDSLFLDVGANIGLFSSNVAKISRIKKGVEVHAFEVDPLTFRRLERNGSRHDFKCHNIGLSDQDMQGIKFVRGAVSGVTTTFVKMNRYSIASKTFFSDVRRLDSIDLPQKDIFLKIDVEGQESAIISGAEAILESGRIYGVYLDGMDQPKLIQQKLKSLGFHLFNGRTLKDAAEEEFSLLAIRQ